MSSNISCILTSKNGTIVKEITLPCDIAIQTAKVWAAHTRSPAFATLTVNGVVVDYMSEFLDAIVAFRRGHIWLDRETMQS